MTNDSFFSEAKKLGIVLPDFSQEPQTFENSSCKILNGKAVAQNIITQCAKVRSTCSKTKTTPHLFVFLVGNNPASRVYVNNKVKIFQQAQFKTTLCELPENISEKELIEKIRTANINKEVHGVLVQLPLPAHIQSELILSSIDPNKDVDGFLPKNLGLLAQNSAEGFRACTPFGIMVLLAAYKIHVAGKHCVVIGRSSIVGKPMGLFLLNANATVTFTHSKTKNLEQMTQNADIIIAATGKKYLLNKNMIKEGTIIVDVGIHKNTDGSLSGDVHPNVQERASFLSPVPGGVGPMTIAMLALNTALAWNRETNHGAHPKSLDPSKK